MAYVPTLKKMYKEQVVPALVKQFGYSSVMQVPVLEKIVINQGLGQAVGDKKIIETAIEELTKITGQKAVMTRSKKDISNFKLRKGMPIGARVTLRHNKMYEFLERLVAVALPRIRDFKGINDRATTRSASPSRSSSRKSTSTRSRRFWAWRSRS
jgi:large subunit ribosomal protein L5